MSLNFPHLIYWTCKDFFLASISLCIFTRLSFPVVILALVYAPFNTFLLACSLKDVQKRTENINTDEDPIGWCPYNSFVDFLRDKYAKNEGYQGIVTWLHIRGVNLIHPLPFLLHVLACRVCLGGSTCTDPLLKLLDSLKLWFFFFFGVCGGRLSNRIYTQTMVIFFL